VCWLYLQVHQVDSALQVLRDTASHLLCTQRAAALHCVEIAINLATTERRKVQARLFIKTKQRILSNVTTEERKTFLIRLNDGQDPNSRNLKTNDETDVIPKKDASKNDSGKDIASGLDAALAVPLGTVLGGGLGGLVGLTPSQLRLHLLARESGSVEVEQLLDTPL